MTDWAEGIEERNFGIRTEIKTKDIFYDFVKTIIPIAAIAGALLFYSWVRSEIINVGYETQNLFELEQSLSQKQKELKLEEKTLRDPQRIDNIARIELGMTPLRPNQFMESPAQAPDRNLSDSIAMSESEAPMIGTKAATRAAEYIPTN
jgi:cell division protein FtsL